MTGDHATNTTLGLVKSPDQLDFNQETFCVSINRCTLNKRSEFFKGAAKLTSLVRNILRPKFWLFFYKPAHQLLTVCIVRNYDLDAALP